MAIRPQQGPMLPILVYENVGSSDDRVGNPDIMTAQKAYTATIG
jgi:hypothetical protein